MKIVRLSIFGLLAYVVYRDLLRDILTDRVHITAYVLFWLFSAYVVLPRINRWLALIYVPQYFIGRTTTADGLLADPVNLAMLGSEADLRQAMSAAGWTEADPVGVRTSLRIVIASLAGRSYPGAPVSTLMLFGRPQTVAFQRQVDGNPRRRHHVRYWRTPEGWYLPGGKQADWLGAATYDRQVGLSLFTGQITHKIDADVDKERDHVVRTLQECGWVSDVERVRHFTEGYHSRNGGGDRIRTDGTLPFVTINKPSDVTAL